MAGKIPFKVGDSRSWARTVDAGDINLYAGLSGDLSRNHINEQYMATTQFKHRIAHGMLTMSMSCSLSTQFADASPVPCVSYGYDKIRFLKPVYINDTLNITYTIDQIDDAAGKTFAKIETKNQNGDLVLVATHILKFFF